MQSVLWDIDLVTVEVIVHNICYYYVHYNFHFHMETKHDPYLNLTYKALYNLNAYD